MNIDQRKLEYLLFVVSGLIIFVILYSYFV